MQELSREEKVQNALADVRAGYTQQDAAAKHGIPKSTLHDRIKRRGLGGPITAAIPRPTKGFKSLTPDQETFLVSWILQEQAQGRNPRRRHVVAFAEQIRLQEGPDPGAVLPQLSAKWYDRFLERHPETGLRKNHVVPAALQSLTSPSQALPDGGGGGGNDHGNDDDDGDHDDDDYGDDDDPPEGGDSNDDPETPAPPSMTSSSVPIHTRYTTASLAPPGTASAPPMPPRQTAAPPWPTAGPGPLANQGAVFEAYQRAKQALNPAAPASTGASDGSLRQLVDKIVGVVEDQAATIKSLEARLAILEAENQRTRRARPLEARLALLEAGTQRARSARPVEASVDEGDFSEWSFQVEGNQGQQAKRRRMGGDLGPSAG